MILVAILLGLVAVLYGAAGQAGGSGFVAVMTFAHFQSGDIRATAFALNIVAAAYAALQIHRAKLVNWKLLALLLLTSIPAAAFGGMISLHGRVYFGVTGAALLSIAGMMLFRRTGTTGGTIPPIAALCVGAITGIVSGVTGVGGGVFLSSTLILVAKASPKDTFALSPPFILANSIAALAGLMLAGQPFPMEALPLSGGVLVGSVAGFAIGLRWMTGNAIRAVLILILVTGGAQMLVRATM